MVMIDRVARLLYEGAPRAEGDANPLSISWDSAGDRVWKPYREFARDVLLLLINDFDGALKDAGGAELTEQLKTQNPHDYIAWRVFEAMISRGIGPG